MNLVHSNSNAQSILLICFPYKWAHERKKMGLWMRLQENDSSPTQIVPIIFIYILRETSWITQELFFIAVNQVKVKLSHACLSK